ncbi:MAG: rhomboid family intramembrane serine protease [Cyclobacteriaceae bacterium]|nr:rhomboid family intramembrane serine protease [Cyclobacteriaceae bacterium]
MKKPSLEHTRFKFAVHVTLGFVGLLWFIKAVELATQANYAFLGVLPRTLRGSIGIVTAPLIHGDLIHLMSNTIPLVMLGFILFYFYSKFAIEVFIWIYLISGFWTWLIARNSYHIGASGVVYGMAAFLFFSGIFRRNRPLMTISAVILFLYGGFLYGIFPGMVESDVSWESHFTGALAGTLLAFLFRKADTGMEDKKIPFDDSDDESAYFSSPDATDNIEATYTFKETRGSDT